MCRLSVGQVAWWFLPAFSLLCLYPFPVPVVHLSGWTVLTLFLGLPRVCRRGSGYWTWWLIPSLPHKLNTCCCYHVWEGARELAAPHTAEESV